MIEQPLTPNAVFVAWRDPKEHRCYPIARLARLIAGPDGHTEYEFVYVNGVREAQQHGFSHIASFDDLGRLYYSSTLFPFFANRIIAETRPERAALLQRLLLEEGDPLEVLSRTGGIRATDTYEVFPLPRFDPTMPGFRTLFLVHALRHFSETTHERIGRLIPGEPLFFMNDCQNEFDPHAIALRTADRVLVGHIPNYLLLEVYELANLCDFVQVSVAQANPLPAPLDQRLLCAIETCWPEDYHPFVADRFQPLAQGATPSAYLIGDPRNLHIA